MSIRFAAVIVSTCLCGLASAQTPNLSRPQRDLLGALVSAVDAASAAPETEDASLRTHVLRASDGSHYVAFSINPSPAAPLPSGSTALYVRLSTARAIGAPRPERSLIRDWLDGTQATPLPLPSNRGIALGDMPVMGVTGNLASPSRAPMNAQTADLAAIDLERRRARERQEARERQRRAELEGRATTTADTLPFEDFDLASATTRVIQRALTTGPGDYFLYVAWADAASPKSATTVRVVKKRLSLTAATTELTIGSVILADGIQVRSAPYKPAEQASHPYAIGLTEIVPAADATFADTENVAVVFQVINPQPAENGKPNVDIAFEVVRVLNTQEQPVAALTPQNYSEKNLPAEFDLRAGHPLFATVSAPLSTLKRGAYRLKILVNDRIAGHSATAATDFTVTATAMSLVREAPPLALPFNRESILSADVLPGLLRSLKPVAMSPQLARAFDLAAASRFVELMVEEPVPATEEGLRAVLRGLAQFAVGEASSAVQFQRAQLLGAPTAVTRVLSGAARAMQSRDADAISAWQEALAAGAPKALVTPYLVDAYLRRGDIARAGALLPDVKAASPGWSRSVAAVLIATQKESDAIPMLEARLAAVPNDTDARWLLLQSLFTQLARDGNKAPASARDRFTTLARVYIDAKGVNSVLAEEWLAEITKGK
jgi:hypothetical protein